MISFGGGHKGNCGQTTWPQGHIRTARVKCGSNSNTQQKYGNTENILCFSAQAMGVDLYL